MLFSGSGCWADIQALSLGLQQHAREYLWENKEEISMKAMAFQLANMLYSKRLFPYFTFSILAGLDDNGIFIKSFIFI